MLDNLTRNDLSAEGSRWLISYLTAIDNRDISAYGTFLADTCSLRMNYIPVMQGKDNVLMMLGSIWSSLAGMRHDPLMILGDDYEFALEAIHHYDLKSGKKTPIPATEFISRNAEGLVTRIRIYCNADPAFSEEN
ncbi:MAG: nuclear transport factor 2 family protein [Pseudomonadota bacterium]